MCFFSYLRERTGKYVGGQGEDGGCYKFFKKKIRGPGDHRPKYFMAQ